MGIYHDLIKARDSTTTLIISDISDLDNLLNPMMYEQIHIHFHDIIDNTIIDLGKFNNAKILYLFSPNNIELVNIPDSVESLYFRMILQNVKIPYKSTIKSIVNLSSMADNYVDFSELYHKYKLHHIDYSKVVGDVSYNCRGNTDYKSVEYYTMQLIDSYSA